MKNETILSVEKLKMFFPIKKGFLGIKTGDIQAVNGVSFHLKKGECLGLVGESGCGKTTVGRCIVNLYKPTAGTIEFSLDDKAVDISRVNDRIKSQVRKNIQMIFQDPYSSLDPRMTIKQTLMEPLLVHRVGTKKEREDKILNLIETVGLNSSHINRYPHEFSGGQRQRIGIARALTLDPNIIVCDEPVSALDVSVQAQVLNLLIKLKKEIGLTYLFIAHDLNVVEYISDRVMVMYLGMIVEIARAEDMYKKTRHPYTQALLDAIPVPNPDSTVKRVVLSGNVPSPANPPVGCNFNERCVYAVDLCRKQKPVLEQISDSPHDSEHQVACHRYREILLPGFRKGV